jgi:hypothetical protein
MAFNLTINCWGDSSPSIVVNYYWNGVAMANKVKWAAESAATLMTTELDNLEDDAFCVDGADYDNATNLHRFADFELFLDGFDAAPDQDGEFEMHIFWKYDGTNYADGYDGDADADSVPGISTYVGSFYVDDANADQRLPLMGVPLKPFAFRACIVNKCNQDLVDSASHHLKIFPYNEEVQG